MRNETKTNRKFWGKTMKSDRWWDFSFFYTIIGKKLEQLEKNWHKSHYLNWQDDLKNIKECRRLFQLLNDDVFLENRTKHIDEKYGETEMSSGPEDERGCSEVILSRPNDPNDEAGCLFREAMKLAAKDKTRTKRKAFLMLYKEIEKWWD